MAMVATEVAAVRKQWSVVRTQALAIDCKRLHGGHRVKDISLSPEAHIGISELRSVPLRTLAVTHATAAASKRTGRESTQSAHSPNCAELLRRLLYCRLHGGEAGKAVSENG